MRYRREGDTKPTSQNQVRTKTIHEPPTPLLLFQRAHALERLAKFLPRIPQYSARRNIVDHSSPSTSELSPALRRRVLLEEEVIQKVLAHFSFGQAEKFLQELLWRTYWKGWLERRPWVWDTYLDEVERSSSLLRNGDEIRLARALEGRTGLEYFDRWVRELRETGYLHNHARMWFASIWIFTLNLPWQLGAKFFLEHLLDGDPASNTLSWRWVGGLHTVGKHYTARAANIAKYTERRFVPGPGELAENPRPLLDDGLSRRSPEPARGINTSLPRPVRAVLLHEEDCAIESGELSAEPVEHLFLLSPSFEWRGHSPSPLVRDFVTNSFRDASRRALERFHSARHHSISSPAELVDVCRSSGVTELFMHRDFIGFVRGRLVDFERKLNTAGASLLRVERRHDQTFLQLAEKGFFPFWQRASRLLHRPTAAKT